MKHLSYSRLQAITNSVPHFRGNQNRFPLGNRRENRKYFLVREENGQKVFDIVYGQRWTRNERLELGNPGAFTALPNIMGTVRPDNSFEFTADSYGQGDNRFFSNMCIQGCFASDSRRGGMVYYERYDGGGQFHPIYKGMRVDTTTMQALAPYEVVMRHVDRKKSKDVIQKYERFFKVSEVMLKNMTMGMVLDVVRDMEAVGTSSGWAVGGGGGVWLRKQPEDYVAEAERLIDEAPLDAFVLYCVGLNVGRLAYQMRWGSRDEQDNAHEKLFMSLKRKLTKEIYRSYASIFKYVTYEQGKKYPTSDWGVKIIVDCEEMEQYA